jgi:hypothetical protein
LRRLAQLRFVHRLRGLLPVTAAVGLWIAGDALKPRSAAEGARLECAALPTAEERAFRLRASAKGSIAARPATAAEGP